MNVRRGGELMGVDMLLLDSQQQNQSSGKSSIDSVRSLLLRLLRFDNSRIPKRNRVLQTQEYAGAYLERVRQLFSQEFGVVIPRPKFYQAHMFKAPTITAKMVRPLGMVSTDIGLPLCHKQLHGHTCKFDHSMSSSSSSLSYSSTVSSLTDMPLTPYPLESSLLSTLAPSSSSSDEMAPSFTLQAPLNSMRTQL
ncbi:Uncharacterized protein Rs2_19704 [Raphanus sativus]|nr:Uncharacterized protein Rs2_19704 [Raphanus sativus]